MCMENPVKTSMVYLFYENSWRLKGCVRYIFASLFCTFKGEHLWNKGKKIHFESSSFLR